MTNGGSSVKAIFYFSVQIFLVLVMYIIQHLTDLNDQKAENVLGKVNQKRILQKVVNIPFVSFETTEIGSLKNKRSLTNLLLNA